MSLLEELKEKLQTVCAEQDEQLAKIRVHEAFLGAAMQDIRDLSRAIAALEPSAVEGSSVAAYFDARRAEALLDPQPEAASPEFASDQDEALPSMDDIIDPDLTGGLQTEEHLDRLHAGTLPQIPEGFTPWSGGECPVSKDQVVELLFRESWAGDGNGRAIYISDPADYADLTQWKHHGQGGDIIAYRVIEAPAEAERTEVDSPPTEQDRVEPAAFAPVNAIEDPDTDALMWANGFEADAKSKAEPEQDKRPFWTRAPKPKVNA